MKSLSDIPNKAGFEFTGVTKNNEKIECVVGIEDGIHVALEKQTKERCYSKLKGWEKGGV